MSRLCNIRVVALGAYGCADRHALSERWGDMPRHLLETLAVEGYRSGILTEHQVGQLLGFDSRVQTDEFLLSAGQFYDLDESELDAQVEAGELAARRSVRQRG